MLGLYFQIIYHTIFIIALLEKKNIQSLRSRGRINETNFVKGKKSYTKKRTSGRLMFGQWTVINAKVITVNT